jgi:hypothetical protein
VLIVDLPLWLVLLFAPVVVPVLWLSGYRR